MAAHTRNHDVGLQGCNLRGVGEMGIPRNGFFSPERSSLEGVETAKADHPKPEEASVVVTSFVFSRLKLVLRRF